MTDVVIKRGVSGLPSVPRDGAPGTYPYGAIATRKIIREAGLTVEFEDERSDRNYVERDADEYWLPILHFAATVGSGVSVGVLIEIIKSHWHKGTHDSSDPAQVPESAPIMHIEATREGDSVKLVLDGPADTVLEALDRFNGWGDDDGPREIPGE